MSFSYPPWKVHDHYKPFPRNGKEKQASKKTNWCFQHVSSGLRDPSLQNFEGMKINSSWWLNQPISKIFSSTWKSSPTIGVKNKNVSNYHPRKGS